MFIYKILITIYTMNTISTITTMITMNQFLLMGLICLFLNISIAYKFMKNKDKLIYRTIVIIVYRIVG
jgi:hypothetical protein